MAHRIIIFVVPWPTAFLCHGDMQKSHGMVAHMAHRNWWLSKALKYQRWYQSKTIMNHFPYFGPLWCSHWRIMFVFYLILDYKIKLIVLNSIFLWNLNMQFVLWKSMFKCTISDIKVNRFHFSAVFGLLLGHTSFTYTLYYENYDDCTGMYLVYQVLLRPSLMLDHFEEL